MDFPQYRARFDKKSYYKVISKHEMEEIQFIGQRKFMHNLKADKYFEKVLIQSILDADDELYFKIEATEYKILLES